MKDDKSIAQLNCEIPEGMKLDVGLKAHENIPRYYKIANGIKNTFLGKQHMPIDAIDEMSKMTPQELWTLKTIKDNLILIEIKLTSTTKKNKTSCKSIIKNANLTNAEQQKFKTGFKRLHEKNIVKRIKREHYLINPDFLIPHFYQEEKSLFDSLT